MSVHTSCSDVNDLNKSDLDPLSDGKYKNRRQRDLDEVFCRDNMAWHMYFYIMWFYFHGFVNKVFEF